MWKQNPAPRRSADQVKADMLAKNRNTRRLDTLTIATHSYHLLTEAQVCLQIYDPKTGLYQIYNTHPLDPDFPAPYERVATTRWPPTQLATPESVAYYIEEKKKKEEAKVRQPISATVESTWEGGPAMQIATPESVAKHIEKKKEPKTIRNRVLPLLYKEINPQQFARLPVAALQSSIPSEPTASQPNACQPNASQPTAFQPTASQPTASKPTAPLPDIPLSSNTSPPPTPGLLPAAPLQPGSRGEPAPHRPSSPSPEALARQHQAISRVIEEDCHWVNGVLVFKHSAGPCLGETTSQSGTPSPSVSRQPSPASSATSLSSEDSHTQSHQIETGNDVAQKPTTNTRSKGTHGSHLQSVGRESNGQVKDGRVFKGYRTRRGRSLWR